MSADTVQAVARALRLIDALAARGGIATLTELTNDTVLSMPTVHRLLRTLQEQGHVQRMANRSYALGAQVMLIGRSASHLMQDRVTPHLRDIVAATGETANAAMLDVDSLFYFARVPSPHSLRAAIAVESRSDLHSTGAGKALLAALPIADAQRIIAESGLPRKTAETVIDADELLAELAEIRLRGFAIDNGEEEIGTRCIAVSVSAP